MAGVVAADVVVVPEIAAVGEIAFAHVPIAGGLDAVYECAVVQHGQIKTAAVPTDEAGCVTRHQFEKFGNGFGFGAFGAAQRADVDFAAPTQAAGDGNDALQMQRHEVAAGFGAPCLGGKFHCFGIADAVGQLFQQADGGGIGNGFYVKGQNRGHVDTLSRKNAHFGMGWAA